MEQKLSRLKEILAEVYDLHAAANLLGWDQQTHMPPGGTEGRGFQIGTLRKFAHVKSSAEEVGKLLNELAAFATQQDPDSDVARLVKVARRNYEKNTRIPAEWVGENVYLTSAAYPAWVIARRENPSPWGEVRTARTGATGYWIEN